MQGNAAEVQREVVVANRQGLHARPVTQFVQLANKFSARVEVVHGDLVVDGKSVMSMMRLAAECGTPLRIRATGPDAQAMVEQLVALVKSKFGED